MNRSAILQLADFIESAQFEFDMTIPWVPSCGSAACIGGHAVMLWPELTDRRDSWNEQKLADKLGISWAQQEAICYPDEINDQVISKAQALAMLRRLGETGQVSWELEEQGI